jgi:hypothetical protein
VGLEEFRRSDQRLITSFTKDAFLSVLLAVLFQALVTGCREARAAFLLLQQGKGEELGEVVGIDFERLLGRIEKPERLEFVCGKVVVGHAVRSLGLYLGAV